MRRKISWLFVIGSLFLMSCLPGGQKTNGGHPITVYGFSIMKEALEKEIYLAFAAKSKAEHGEEIHFNSSFAGLETVTNQISQGAPVDVYNKPATEYVATFLGAANLLLGVVRGQHFESENIFLELEEETNLRDG